MDAQMFQSVIHKLLGNVDFVATESWLSYIDSLEQSEIETASDFFAEMCGELEIIKRKYGVEIALLLYNTGKTFTFNPFELQTAAKYLHAGKTVDQVSQLAVEEDFFTMPQKYRNHNG